MSEYNWQKLAEAARVNGGGLRPGDLAGLFATMEQLRHLPFPYGYLDSVRDQMVEVLREKVRSDIHPMSVYLAFHGNDNGSAYMKVGVARRVEARMSALRTGNPLARLWTFSTALGNRRDAYKLERALLSHLKDSRVEGEWVEARFSNLDAAWTFVESLEEFSRQYMNCPEIKFEIREG